MATTAGTAAMGYMAARNPTRIVKSAVKFARVIQRGSRSFANKKVPRTVPRHAKHAPGRSAGRMTSRKSVRRYRKTRQAKLSRNGVVLHIQSGQVVTMATGGNKQSVVLGHATCPQQTILTAGWVSIMKTFVERLGLSIINLDDAIPFIVGDVLIFRYRLAGNTDCTTLNFALVATDTVQSLAEQFANATAVWNSATNNTSDQTEFDYIRYVPTGTQVNLSGYRMHFATVKLAYDVQTHMKVQNRSVLGTDTDDSAVDNVPLYGKTYEGIGTGPKYLNMESTAKKNNFIADSYYGNIIPRVNSVGADSSLVEPPDPQMFDGVKSFGNLKLDPGDIKTSTLSWKKNYKFADWYATFYSSAPTPATPTLIFTPVYRKVGKFRLFAIQKMIDAEQSTITLGLENEIKICVDATGGKETPSVAKMLYLTYTPPQPAV